ncbi:hypothetical protein MMC17_000966 [Xylographa soralifera]|nr:hypothetical protein [Xylographa soralifera]
MSQKDQISIHDGRQNAGNSTDTSEESFRTATPLEQPSNEDPKTPNLRDTTENKQPESSPNDASRDEDNKSLFVHTPEPGGSAKHKATEGKTILRPTSSMSTNQEKELKQERVKANKRAYIAMISARDIINSQENQDNESPTAWVQKNPPPIPDMGLRDTSKSSLLCGILRYNLPITVKDWNKVKAAEKIKIERIARQLATETMQNPNHWKKRKADAKKVLKIQYLEDDIQAVAIQMAETNGIMPEDPEDVDYWEVYREEATLQCLRAEKELNTHPDGTTRIDKGRVIMYPNDEEATEYRRTGDPVFYRINPVTNGVANFHHVDAKGGYVGGDAVDMEGREALLVSREVARAYFAEQRERILIYENHVTLYRLRIQVWVSWHVADEVAGKAGKSYRRSTAKARVEGELSNKKDDTTVKMTKIAKRKNFGDKRDTLLKDLRRLQSYLVEMGHAEHDDLQGIWEDTETETTDEIFNASYTHTELQVWKATRVTDRDVIAAVIKILCAGKQSSRARDLTGEEVVKYCCSIGWDRAALMESQAAAKLYKRVWDLYW